MLRGELVMARFEQQQQLQMAPTRRSSLWQRTSTARRSTRPWDEEAERADTDQRELNPLYNRWLGNRWQSVPHLDVTHDDAAGKEKDEEGAVFVGFRRDSDYARMERSCLRRRTSMCVFRVQMTTK